MMSKNGEISDDEKFAKYGSELHNAVNAAVAPWLQNAMHIRGVVVDDALSALLDSVILEVDRSIGELVTADVDAALSGPLERIRQAVAPINNALAERNVSAPRRNAVDEQMRPNDTYELGPMTFRDLSDQVHEAGITWGAAKAHLHLKRRQAP